MLSILAVTMVWGCSGKVPSNLGVKQGLLMQCPESPNCVNSQADVSDARHFVNPLTYQGDLASARERLKAILESLPRNHIVEQDEQYLRVEFTSAVMGFVDDVEFFFDSDQKVAVRSASRLGYSDFGVNRKRIEAIRQLFEK